MLVWHTMSYEEARTPGHLLGCKLEPTTLSSGLGMRNRCLHNRRCWQTTLAAAVRTGDAARRRRTSSVRRSASRNRHPRLDRLSASKAPCDPKSRTRHEPFSKEKSSTSEELPGFHPSRNLDITRSWPAKPVGRHMKSCRHNLDSPCLLQEAVFPFLLE